MAALVGGDLVCIVPGAASESKRTSDAKPTTASSEALTPLLGDALDAYVGAEGWRERGRGRPSDAPDVDSHTLLTVRLRVVPVDQVADEALKLVSNRQDDLLLYVTTLDRNPEGVHARVSPRILRRATGRVSYIVPGRRRVDGRLVATVAEGPHARAAIRIASRLSKAHDRPLTAVYVEPDVGVEAKGVGRRFLERILFDALEGETADIRRIVEIDGRIERGVLRACEDDDCDAVFVGSARIRGVGEAPRGVAQRLARGLKEPTLIAVRSGMPLHNRAQRLVDDRLDRFVPQLTREERTDLVERVQSNSRWNFDFISLTALSTLIAAMGLIDNSPAVIIGAMLVAPLMTPLLGLGLALSQGNVQLVKMTTKTVFLGFLTAFAIGAVVGQLTPGFEASTSEMDARDWPMILDLVIAFAAGLAAAYASGRPGLLAALPGVAIAAALLPPIATSGLAISLGDFHLAAGSMILFLVNMVAIVYASYLSLWAVGIRFQRNASLGTRILRNGLAAIILGTALLFVIAPPRSAPPPLLVDAIESHLGAHSFEGQLRARRLRLKWDSSGGLILQVDLGGGQHLTPEARRELLEIARGHLGKDTEVRLTFRHEVHLD